MMRGLLALDIDGVLTDGTVSINAAGDERKLICYRDIDAVFGARREGLAVALLTAENTPVAARIAERLEVEHFLAGRRNKGQALRDLAKELGLTIDRVCFIGDSAKDAEALEMAGLGLAPADAEPAARRAADVVLVRKGGHGAVAEGLVLFLTRLVRETGEASAPGVSERSTAWGEARRAVQDLIEVLRNLERTGLHDVLAAGELLSTALKRGGNIYVFGNGRSAAHAQHLVAEIMHVHRGESGAGRAIALTDGTAPLTSLTDDAGFGEVFSQRLECLGKPGDVAVAITVSDRSEDIRHALAAARQGGMNTIVMAGAMALNEALADVQIRVSSTNPRRIQEAHGAILHLLCRACAGDQGSN